ncbi:hypothetical protein RND81_07G066300 [Saponaria officinalis]|uniref:Protein FAR1-RELATED SEQUENCE n=1 Tax=Saponaria officinalis TaxID=3572 RepID=A0AAW1JN74_SAPOF
MRKISIVIDRYMIIQILSDSWLHSITSEEIDTRQGRFGDPLMVERRLMDESLLRPTDDGDSVEVDQSLNKNLFSMILKIGATKTYKMCKEHVNGFENIGASLNDFKNFHRDVKCYINERDEQLFIDRFKNLADTREDFYFDYEVDVDNSLIRAIWADGTTRRNYAVFGDAVSFDPTYSTNKLLFGWDRFC